MSFSCSHRRVELQLSVSLCVFTFMSLNRQTFNIKMPQTNVSFLKYLLLVFGVLWECCRSQVNSHEANRAADGRGGDGGGAFFALRSCHQLLHGDSGEFFSPDYLCSNPPLWCNWTIQVDAGKRVILQLEDLTPDDACHSKQDQLHVDEPAGHPAGHKVLQRCWQEARFTSSSNTLYVVLLIGGWQNPPYRGFYGHYQAFGPPLVYNPEDGQSGFTEVMAGEGTEPDLEDPVRSDLLDDDTSAERLQKTRNAADSPLKAEVDEHLHPASERYSHVDPFVAVPTMHMYTQVTSRSGRGAVQSASEQADPPAHVASPRQQHENSAHQPKHSPPVMHRNVDPSSAGASSSSAVTEETKLQNQSEEEEEPAAGKNGSEVTEASERRGHPHPNMVAPPSDHQAEGLHHAHTVNVGNRSESAHLPGDHLFEVTVEVTFAQHPDGSWDSVVRSLLMSVKTLISEQLEVLRTVRSISSKRIKRLNAGVLFILWLHIGQGPGGSQVHNSVRSTLQGLINPGDGLKTIHGDALIVSVSTADVDECGTQLVLCDANADCVNQFGSYSCHCRVGFQDKSRLGSGGTVCVKAAGCSSGLSAATKGVYVIFFLLSSLILILLVVTGALYHRHHRGAFLIHCHSGDSVSSANNRRCGDGYYSPTDSDLPPPPPPPARGPRECRPQVKEPHPAVDLPLLRFSRILPPDNYMEPQEDLNTELASTKAPQYLNS